jgi:hypothetical protein
MSRAELMKTIDQLRDMYAAEAGDDMPDGEMMGGGGPGSGRRKGYKTKKPKKPKYRGAGLVPANPVYGYGGGYLAGGCNMYGAGKTYTVGRYQGIGLDAQGINYDLNQRFAHIKDKKERTNAKIQVLLAAGHDNPAASFLLEKIQKAQALGKDRSYTRTMASKAKLDAKRVAKINAGYVRCTPYIRDVLAEYGIEY